MTSELLVNDQRPNSRGSKKGMFEEDIIKTNRRYGKSKKYKDLEYRYELF